MMRRNGGTLSKRLPFSRAEDWPDPPTEDFLPHPRMPKNLLAHWEWWLYRQYTTAYQDHAEGISPGWNQQWKTQVKDFYKSLIASKELMGLCQEHASRPLHHVMVLLFFFADLVKKESPVRGIFGIECRGTMDKGLAQARREAKRDARALEKIKRLAEGVSRLSLFDDERATLNTIVDRVMHRAVSPATPSTLTFDDIVFPKAEIKTPMLEPKPKPKWWQQQNNLFRHGADLNLYLALLVNFLEKCQRRGKLKSALAILDQFHPPQFGNNYTEDHLRLRLRDFCNRPGAQEHIKEMTKWFEHPSVTELCPCPTFLLPLTSATVADEAR